MENIKVCVRMRPQPKEEDFSQLLWHIEGNSIINTKTKDIFSYGISSLNIRSNF